MTAPNPVAVQRCIRAALEVAATDATEVDVINGHLTATAMDALEIRNWSTALQRRSIDFPIINSLKGMIGHTLSAAGSIECVASILQLHQGFVFPNVNCEDLHPEVLETIDASCIPQTMIAKEFDILVKASFGFGDVNACIVFKKYHDGK